MSDSSNVFHFVPVGLVERCARRRGQAGSYVWKQGYSWQGTVPWMTRAEARRFAETNGGRATFARC